MFFFLLLNLATVEADYMCLYKKLFDFFKSSDSLLSLILLPLPSPIPFTIRIHLLCQYKKCRCVRPYRLSSDKAENSEMDINNQCLRSDYKAVCEVCSFQVSICTKMQAVTIFRRG